MTLDINKPHANSRARAGDLIYQSLRHLIVSGRMAGGTRLVEEDLAGQFSSSRTPVREAMRRLEHDGLVVVVRRGHLVSVAISGIEREELHRLRLKADEVAVRAGHARAVSANWAAAREKVEKLGRVMDRNGMDSLAFAVAHLEVHAEINQILWSGPIAAKFAQDAISYTTSADNAHPDLDRQSAVDQHLHLIDELRSDDRDRALRAMQLHARQAYARE